MRTFLEIRKPTVRQDPPPMVNPHEFCTADDPSAMCQVCREMWDEAIEAAGQQKLPLEGE